MLSTPTFDPCVSIILAHHSTTSFLGIIQVLDMLITIPPVISLDRIESEWNSHMSMEEKVLWQWDIVKNKDMHYAVAFEFVLRYSKQSPTIGRS